MATKKTVAKSPAQAKSVALRAARPSLTTVFPHAGSSLEQPIFSMEGKKVGTVALPPEIFGAPWRADLVHQVTTAMQANLRQNRAHTKDRSEVSGGGITFGPRNVRNYSEKINKKRRIGALLSVLSRKAKEGEIILVNNFAISAPKTSVAKTVIEKLAKGAGAAELVTKKKNTALIALASYNKNTTKSFSNFGNMKTEETRSLNPVDVLTHKYLIIENPEVAFKLITARIKNK